MKAYGLFCAVNVVISKKKTYFNHVASTC